MPRGCHNAHTRLLGRWALAARRCCVPTLRRLSLLLQCSPLRDEDTPQEDGALRGLKVLGWLRVGRGVGQQDSRPAQAGGVVLPGAVASARPVKFFFNNNMANDD